MRNEDFDRRIEIANQIGIHVHSKEMRALQAMEKTGNLNEMDLSKQPKDKIISALSKVADILNINGITIQ